MQIHWSSFAVIIALAIAICHIQQEFNLEKCIMTHDYHTLLHASHPRLPFQGSDGFNCNRGVPRSCSTAQRVEQAAKLSFSSCSSLDKPETNSQPPAWSPYNRDTAWGHKKGTSIFKFVVIKALKVTVYSLKWMANQAHHAAYSTLHSLTCTSGNWHGRKKNEAAWCVWWVVRLKL